MVATNSAATSAIILFPLLFFFHPSLELPLFRRADKAKHSQIHAATAIFTPPPVAAPAAFDAMQQTIANLSPFKVRKSTYADDVNPEQGLEQASPSGPSATSGAWAIPKSPSHLFFDKNSTRGRKLAARDWMQPEVLTSYARLFHKDESMLELAVFTTGVTMGAFRRNFNATHCLVGDDMFPVTRTEVDTFYCLVSRHVGKGEPVTVVLALDERLQAALDGPVTLRLRTKTTLDRRTIGRLPVSARIADDGILPNERHMYRIVRTKHTMPIDTRNLPSSLKGYEKKARYETCILAPVKLTSHLLQPWVDYHRRIGIDHVFILDNDDPTDVAGQFRDRPDVDVLYWPYRKSQSQHLTFALMWTRHYCRALHICDGDEYMMFGLGKNMELASRRPFTGFSRRRSAEGYNMIFFPYLMMSHSGVLRQPTKAPAEVYVHKATKKSSNIKSTMFLDHPWTISTLHLSRGWHKSRGHFKRRYTLFPEDRDDRPVEVHFWKRSYEEMVTKKNHGSGDITDNQAIPKKIERPDFDNPPEEYVNVDQSRRYTYFRKLWREVTRVGPINLVSIVRETDKGRCARVYNWELERYVGKEVCGDAMLRVDDDVKR